MSKNLVKEVSESFVKASIALIERYMKNDGAGGRRAAIQRNNCYCEFRDLGEEGLAELRRLMKHPHMAVRLSAASRYRWIDRYEGLKVIEALTANMDSYPVGSIEREVAFTAYNVLMLSVSKTPPPMVDPYDAWQKTKEEKAKAEDKPKG